MKYSFDEIDSTVSCCRATVLSSSVRVVVALVKRPLRRSFTIRTKEARVTVPSRVAMALRGIVRLSLKNGHSKLVRIMEAYRSTLSACATRENTLQNCTLQNHLDVIVTNNDINYTDVNNIAVYDKTEFFGRASAGVYRSRPKQ